LRRKGAMPWPNPENSDAFNSVFEMRILTKEGATQVGLPLPCTKDASPSLRSMSHTPSDRVSAEPSSSRESASAVAIHENREKNEAAMEFPQLEGQSGESAGVMRTEFTAGEILFSTAREVIQRLLKSPMKESELASALQVSTSQVRAWLLRLIDEDVVTKQRKPVAYITKQPPLFRG
jgi:DNA processing protein